MDNENTKRLVRSRRRAVCAAVCAAFTVESSDSKRGAPITRPIFSWPIYISGLRTSFFARMYRMNKPTLFALAERLLIFNNGRKYRYCGLLRLSLTLRWLAVGSYLDIALSHQQSISSVYMHIDTMLRGIENALTLHFTYEDGDWLVESSGRFSRSGRSPINRCVADLDGIAIKIQEPSRRDVPN